MSQLAVRRTLTGAVLAAGALLACRGPSGDAPGVRRVARGREVEVGGRYTHGFETSAFRACGSAAAWWVTSLRAVPSVRAAADARRPAGRMGSTVYVRWRGVVSDSGAYGHLAAYPHAFSPTAVVTVGDEAPADCR